MNIAPLQTYFQTIADLYKHGDVTEHSYRGALGHLLESLLPDISAINEPKRKDCGAPDYVVERNRLIIGYVEAKDIKVSLSLDRKEKDEQLTRYRRALENLLLTDYLEFRWYVQSDGNLAEKKMMARLATPQA